MLMVNARKMAQGLGYDGNILKLFNEVFYDATECVDNLYGDSLSDIDHADPYAPIMRKELTALVCSSMISSAILTLATALSPTSDTSYHNAIRDMSEEVSEAIIIAGQKIEEMASAMNSIACALEEANLREQTK